jgi:hypothetical protein
MEPSWSSSPFVFFVVKDSVSLEAPVCVVKNFRWDKAGNTQR